MTRRVAVILGGRSSENAISIASATSVVAALEAAGDEVVTVEIDRAGRWALGTGRRELGVGEPGSALERLPAKEVAATLGDVDVVFPVLHGPFGEDGTVQGLLELAGVPYVGAGVLASALCMDKDVFKSVMRDHDIPVTRNITLRLGDEPRNPFGYPCFIKPARLGSSIGITKAHDDEELRRGVRLAFEHDEKVLVEELVVGVEVEVGVLGNLTPIASLPGEIVVTHNEWYDFDAKYDEGEMDLRRARRDHGRADRTRAGARGARVRRHGLRRDGARRLLRPQRRRGARERAEHDPRLHADQRVRPAVRGLRHPVRGTARAAGRPGRRALRTPFALTVLEVLTR